MKKRDAWKRRSFVTGTLAACGAVAGLRFPGSAAEFTFRLGVNVSAANPRTIRTVEAVNKIRDDTSGRVEIKVFPGSVLGNEPQALAQLRIGAIEMVELPPQIVASVVPAAGLDSLDFIFADYKQAYAASDGALGNYMRAAIAKGGMVPIARTMNDGFKELVVNRAIVTPDDMKGLKIRVVPTPVQIGAFKALGAAPVPLPYEELYPGMQTHLVDGAELSWGAVLDGKFFEVAKYGAQTNHLWASIVTIAHPDAWERLPRNLRTIVEKNFDDAVVRLRGDIERLAQDATGALQAKGMTVTKVDFTAFQSVIQKSGLYGQWRDAFGTEAWSALEKAIGKRLV